MKVSNLLIIMGSSILVYTAFSYFSQLSIGSYGDSAVSKAMAKPVRVAQVDSKPKDNKIVYSPLYPKRPKQGENIGYLIIPKIKAVLPIIEGTDPDDLAKGVGHYSGSVLPGESDNSVLSGHRDTVFRRVGELKVGDKLIVKTEAGTFTYKITRTWIVDKDDRSVIVSHKGEKLLTLTTCYPFNWFGPAPQRYIIQSKLVDF